MNKCNLRMCRCFKFQERDASAETWIITAKFSLKISIFSEDVDKMQTELLQSGMHSPLP